LPFIGVSFVLGGVEAGEVLRGVGMVIVTAAVVGCLSLVCSSLMRRTQGATVLSYAMVLVLLGGTFVAFGAQMLADQRGPAGRMQAMMWANPLMATADVLSRQTGDNLIPTPFTELQNLIDERLDTNRDGVVAGRDGGGFGPRVFVENAVGIGMPAPDVIDLGPGGQAAARPDLDDPSLLHRAPFWLLSVLTWAVLCGLGFWLACHRLRTPVDGAGPA
jgi:hypothetical protein